MKKINWKDGKMWASLIALGIVLVQQLMAIFGVTVPVDWQGVVGTINSVLTFLGALGVLSDVTKVNLPENGDDEKNEKQN